HGMIRATKAADRLAQFIGRTVAVTKPNVVPRRAGTLRSLARKKLCARKNTDFLLQRSLRQLFAVDACGKSEPQVISAVRNSERHFRQVLLECRHHRITVLAISVLNALNVLRQVSGLAEFHDNTLGQGAGS